MRPLLENWRETCNDYRSTLENSAKREFVRWDLKDQPGTARAEESGTWQQDVDKLQDWIAQRTAYMTCLLYTASEVKIHKKAVKTGL